MKRLQTSMLIFLTLLSGLSYGQTQYEIDNLLTVLYKTKNSKELSTKPEAIKIMSYGEKSLPFLANNFIDTAFTEVKSDCQNLMLRKGEVAIILADRIEFMPYAQLTNIQNSLMEFCKDNPNLVEYYLIAIRRDNATEFQKRYKVWLTNKERKTWNSSVNNKKKKRK